MPDKIDLKSLSREELLSFAKAQGLPKYRVGQLLHWMYERYAQDLQEITEFSKALREDLGRERIYQQPCSLSRARGQRTAQRNFSSLLKTARRSRVC